MGLEHADYVDEIELVRGASHDYNQEDFENATVSPVYFGTALGNFGVRQMLDGFVEQPRSPQPMMTQAREVLPSDE